ncbi:ATP-binding protein, partial [Dyadobacter frigoris]|uniref:ATP-binding protein n=1 Tax=Dyadobacter frigoris TaxID=2576211 RepID=UPI00286E0EE9
LDILEDRYGKSATIVTSQLPVDKWHEFINEPSVADYHHFFIMRSNLSLYTVKQALTVVLALITSHNIFFI